MVEPEIPETDILKHNKIKPKPSVWLDTTRNVANVRIYMGEVSPLICCEDQIVLTITTNVVLDTKTSTLSTSGIYNKLRVNQ